MKVIQLSRQHMALKPWDIKHTIKQQTPALSGVCYIFIRSTEQMFLFRKFSEP